MRVSSTVAFFALVLLTTAADRGHVEMPRFGQLPVPLGWRVLDRGSYAVTNHWVVFEKEDKGELLSFYVFGPPRSHITDATSFTDTAHEIFPDGRIARMIRPSQTNSRGPSLWSLRSCLVSIDGCEALSYSFVADFEGMGENLLAHGYVLFGDFAMIVQHTSGKPATPEFVSSVAARTMRALRKISASENLKTR
jgi:hypothetical protein